MSSSPNPFEASQVPQTESQPDIQLAPEEDAARHWLNHVYQGDRVAQLTPRSVITGMLIGGVMSISNLYVGLKAGWGLGVTITACIIAYAVFNALEKIIPAYRDKPFTILENYTMSSAASAAGYMSSAGLVSSIPALYMTTNYEMSGVEMMCWLGAISFLGVFMAIPLKRQLINIDQLPFPSGIATAETLRSMHSSGDESMSKARSLLAGALIGGALAFWKGLGSLIAGVAGWFGGTFDKSVLAPYLVQDEYPLIPGEWGRRWLERQSIGIEGSLIMVAAGAIMGIRVGISLLLGAIIYYGVIGDYLVSNGITDAGYGKTGINAWTLWPATAMMVTSGLLSFAMKWQTIMRAFSGLASVFRGKKTGDPLAHIEVPGSWFAAGTLVSGVACVLLGHFYFQISWWMGALAVIITFLLSIVAARATGETDITPIGAMGKITQLMYGVISPQNMTTNLMTASITAGAASHSADLLTDLKSGYLLGGNPRKQTISQLFGVIAGTIICVPVYMIIAKPEKLGGTELPAPAAKVWAGVAQVLAKGLDALPKHALTAMVIGGVIGIVLTLIEEFAPPRIKKWMPSSTGLGIAGVIPAFNCISMFAGALIAWLLSKSRSDLADKYTISVSSGMIAGETLIAVGIILISEGKPMLQEISSHLSTLFGG
jgi:OPT family oligopeptide transporter